MSVISEWFIIKQLETDFVDNKNFVTIVPKYSATVSNAFHHNGYLSVYCVTNDDNVHKYECFDGEYVYGDGRKNSISDAIKVKELCQKNVIDIKCGMNFVVALTNSGRIYSWGLNDFGQLGHGNQNNQYLKPTLINTLIDKCVVDISCGLCHCVALTRNGEVFEWGLNCVTDENITVPVQVIGLQYQTIISIACGVYHTLVLTENAEVFSWGMNSKGQLGIANNTNQCNPSKVDNLNGDKIVKISCGPYHSMLLSENGEIYVFGANNFGQIGDETTDSKNIPVKLITATKFVDIAAPGFYKNQISLAMSSDGFCYVWGRCDELSVKRPAKTEFKSIAEVMMKYSKYKATYKPYYFEKTYEVMSPSERIKHTFNAEEFRLNDIKFKIDGKYIYAQKQYLISVCQHFDTLFSNEWIESTKNEIEITQYSYSVYYSFLKYLYANSVEIKSKDLIELYYLSDSYFEKSLKQKCVEIMKQVINVNNVINFYAFAVNNNFDDLEKYTFDYMKTRMKCIVKSEAYIQLNDISISKRLFISALNNGTFS